MLSGVAIYFGNENGCYGLFLGAKPPQTFCSSHSFGALMILGEPIILGGGGIDCVVIISTEAGQRFNNGNKHFQNSKRRQTVFNLKNRRLAITAINGFPQKLTQAAKRNLLSLTHPVGKLFKVARKPQHFGSWWHKIFRNGRLLTACLTITKLLKPFGRTKQAYCFSLKKANEGMRWVISQGGYANVSLC